MPTILGFSPTAQVSVTNRDALRERRGPGTTGGGRGVEEGHRSDRGGPPPGATGPEEDSLTSPIYTEENRIK